MTNTKRVDELEVGDRVIFPSCEKPNTIVYIEQVDHTSSYKILFKDWDNLVYDFSSVQVTYLGNNKKEKIMEAKVDYSALYPYFDTLANDELTLKYTNIPTHVKQHLDVIHKLFDGVLDLTLEEMKTLYFKRKMSKSEVISEKEDCKFIIKKARKLCLGDKVFLSTEYGNSVEIITKLTSVFPKKVRFDWGEGYALFDLEAEVKILN